eukprot:PhM_4_TR2579/c0_g1_i1/m.84505
MFIDADSQTTMRDRDPLQGTQQPCLSFGTPNTALNTTQTLVFVGESGCGKTVAMLSFPNFFNKHNDVTTFVCYGNRTTFLKDYKRKRTNGSKRATVTYCNTSRTV